MKSMICAAVVCCLCCGGNTLAQESADPREMMKKWMAAITPGPEHKMLEGLAGSWNVNIKVWFAGPGSEPTVTKGTSELTMICDGRFLQENLTGEFMMPDQAGAMKAVPFKAQSTIGYDRFRHMFVGSLTSNLSTAMLTCTGAKNPAGNVITLYGEMDEPMLDVVGRTVKYVLTIKDKDHTTLSIIDLHAGENYKVVEYEYERKK